MGAIHWRLVIKGPDVSGMLPPLAEIETACRALALGIDASELHGSLCGWLAGGGADDAGWLAAVLADADLPAPDAGSALDRLRVATVEQFEAGEFALELLLPGDEARLVERSEALFAWCRGFVGAFGLASGTAPALSEEGSEALADLVRLSAAGIEDDGGEEEEEALAEIGEFVRVAALLLHGDCVLGQRYRNRLN